MTGSTGIQVQNVQVL